ncbi:hypothetical protein SBC2_85340 (plasmid) [Caballeronia sp. SBC2]|nr:hypothetical protein SBC2_85340 [Caballeronia sp. SBC2]
MESEMVRIVVEVAQSDNPSFDDDKMVIVMEVDVADRETARALLRQAEADERSIVHLGQTIEEGEVWISIEDDVVDDPSPCFHRADAIDALDNGAPFAEFPAGFKRLQAILLKHAGGDREMVEILALVLLHDEQAVLTAVELALEAGTPSKQTVLNFLSRLLDGAPVPPLRAPQAAALRVEPEANVSRYDRLRDREDHQAA